MAKDPAFLWYSKDWLTNTTEWSLEEKGAMAELKSYQHLNGSIPADLDKIARILRISIEHLNRIWKTIGSKFSPAPESERLIDSELQELMDDRAEKAHRNRISGTFASVLRGAELSKNQYKEVRKSFRIDDFTETPTERLTETITEWLSKCLKSIGNGDAIANGDGNATKEKGVQGEKPKSLHHRMQVHFLQVHERKKQIPFVWDGKSAKHLKEVIPKIEQSCKSKDEQVVFQFWETMLENLPDWYFQNGFSPSTINSKFNEIVNKIHKPNATNNANIDKQLAEILAAGNPYARKDNQPAGHNSQ